MRGEPDTRRAGARSEQQLQLRQGISATGRVQLKELMKEGLGDHVLYLRLFQARPSSSGQGLSREFPRVPMLMPCTTCLRSASRLSLVQWRVQRTK